jgi:hypothetical protein
VPGSVRGLRERRLCRARRSTEGGVGEPSLRANGSRERAPDDRLREAIHSATQRKNGLLRRIRLRPKAGLRRTRVLLAMTMVDINSRSRGTMRPSCACSFAP